MPMTKYSPWSSVIAPRRWPSMRTLTPGSGCFFSSPTRPVSFPVVPASAGTASASATTIAASLRAHWIERDMRFSPFRYDEIRVEPASVAGSNAVRPDLDEGGYSDGGSAARYMTNLRFRGVVIDG